MVFINDFSPEMVNFGPISIRWYGLLFAVGIILNYLLVKWIFQREKYPVPDLESLLFYLFPGLVIGARLGEVLFYEPGYFFSNPSEIIKIWHGGLSSHGATIGLFVAYLIWIKVHKAGFTRYADALAIGMPITAAFVRTGNFFNSEIVGIPTGSATVPGKWGVVFKRLGEDFPRHPVQLYEALLSIVIFLILFSAYKKYYRNTPPLFFMFLYIMLYFAGRFIIEFYKDLHVLPEEFPLSMGQVLSILPILISLGYFVIIFPKQSKRY